MNNKKNGFTLIEIIGAIVILGVIAVIAFVTYTKNLKEFRQSYYTREKKTVEKSAEEFFDNNRNYRPTKILNAQEVLVSTLTTQDYLNDVVDYNGDNCNEASYVMVVKEGQDDYSYHACLICEKDGYDNTSEDIYCDKTWLDPTKVEYGIGKVDKKFVYKGTTRDKLKEELELPISYIRKDNNGKVIAERRGTKEGNETLFPINLDAVDTSKIGIYKVTYRYGEEEKQGEVEVYENESPTVTYKKENTVVKNMKGDEKVEKTNYTSGEWAQSIIVKLESKKFVNDNISTSRFQWNVDGKWEDFCETDPCEKKVTKELNQSIQFRLVDTNGNISLLTSPVQMRIDRTKPRCSLTIPTQKGSNDWYKTDVNITFGEKIDQKSSDDNRIVSGIKNYNIQKSTETLKRDATVDSVTHKEDTASVTYKGYVEDEAENFIMCEITFKRDATAPKCTESGDSTSWTNSNRTINYGCSDALSLCDDNNKGGSTTFSTTTKTSKISSYKIKDKAGNEKTCAERVADVYVDKTAPSCTQDGDNSTWTKNNITISYGCDDKDSGCDDKNKGGSITFKETTKTSKISSYKIKDKAGNEKTCNERVADVYVDKTAPSCTQDGDNTTWTKNNITISYGCRDDESGCDDNNKGGSTTFKTTTKTSKISSYKIKDKVGNEKTCNERVANVYVDKTNPKCQIVGENTTWTNKGVEIRSTCEDADSKCVASIVAATTVTETNKTVKIAKYTVQDKAGNVVLCDAKEVNAYVDRTAPSCTHDGDNTTWTNSNVTIAFGCDDKESGCDDNNKGGSTTFKETTKTSKISSYKIKDKVGNEKTCNERVANVFVDKTAPSCTQDGDNTTWTNNNVTIAFGCDDKDSGCDDNNKGGSTTFKETTYTAKINSYKIKDKAGNEKTCNERVADIYIDKTNPVCKLSGENASWTTSDVTVKYVCEDADSGCLAGSSGGSILFNTTTKTSKIGPYTIKDTAGNSVKCDEKNINVYVGKPVTCSAGNYFNKTKCETCPAGKYCPGGTFNYNETVQGLNDCPSGYTDGGTGKSAISGCTKKVPCGKYVETANGDAKSCLAGTYKEEHTVAYGSTSKCTSASAGYFVSSNGACTQAVCGDGTTSDGGATGCYAVCQQTEKEAICGGYCSDSEITYYNNETVTTLVPSPWAYYDASFAATGPQPIPEGKCIINKDDPEGKVCYVFNHFHTCSTGVSTGVQKNTWYNPNHNAYGIEYIDGVARNKIVVYAHFSRGGNPHCAHYFNEPPKAKCQ